MLDEIRYGNSQNKGAGTKGVRLLSMSYMKNCCGIDPARHVRQ